MRNLIQFIIFIQFVIAKSYCQNAITQFDNNIKNQDNISDTIIKTNPFSVSIEGGVHQPIRNYKLKDIQKQEYYKFKTQSESLTLNSYFGLFLTYNAKRFRYSTGFDINELIEKVNYRYTDTVIAGQTTITIKDNSFFEYSIVDTFFRIIAGDTIPIIIKDSSLIVKLDTLAETNYNQTNSYRFFEIPVLVTYKYFGNDRFSLDFGMGLILGFLYQTKGITTTKNKEIPIKNQLSLYHPFASAVLNQRVNVLINNYFDLYISAQYRYQFYSMYKKTDGVAIRNDSFIIGLGLRYFI